MIDYIIKIGSLLTALIAVGGVVVAIIKWITVQNRQSDEIAILKNARMAIFNRRLNQRHNSDYCIYKIVGYKV